MPHVPGLPWGSRFGRWVGAGAFLFAAASANANSVSESTRALLADWPLTADITAALVVAAALYARGLMKMRGKRVVDAHRGRHWAYFAGLACIFIALQTPLDVIAEHIFAVHQVQHLLLRGIAPMLLMLAVPAGPLIAGTPAVLRRALLVPLLKSRITHAIFRLFTRPLICTALYAGTLYIWQVPAIHDAALLDEALHYLMHVTMLASGLLFFWAVFDPRPTPWGTPFSTRLVMMGTSIFANIPLGAVLTLKTTVIYVAYEQLGRWWGVAPIDDELLGGLIIWIPASMMGLTAVLLLVRLWTGSETSLDERRQRGFTAPSGAAGHMDARRGVAGTAARRSLGWRLALIPFAVFAGVMVLGISLARHSKPLPGTAAISEPMATAIPQIGIQPSSVAPAPQSASIAH